MRNVIFKLFLFGCITAVFCLVYGFFIEPKTLKIRNVEIVEPNWNGDPLKIALISDIHIGGWHVSADRVAKIVETINTQSPDIILIAGDFVNGHDKSRDRSAEQNIEIQKGIGALSNLQSSLGVYAAIGNHDDWYDKISLRRDLVNASVKVIENDVHIITRATSEFCLVGLPDFWTGKRKVNVFDSCPTDSDIVAFMHSPDSFKFLRTDTDLALAGHTHGGQINLPFYGRRITSTAVGSKYAYGEVRYGGIQTFVTAGIGTSILPARFRAPPEIVVISLSGN